MTGWTTEEQKEAHRKVGQEAAFAAERMGARGCFVIAFFENADGIHIMTGGTTPMPEAELLRKLLTKLEIQAMPPSKPN